MISLFESFESPTFNTVLLFSSSWLVETVEQLESEKTLNTAINKPKTSDINYFFKFLVLLV